MATMKSVGTGGWWHDQISIWWLAIHGWWGFRIWALVTKPETSWDSVAYAAVAWAEVEKPPAELIEYGWGQLPWGQFPWGSGMTVEPTVWTAVAKDLE